MKTIHKLSATLIATIFLAVPTSAFAVDTYQCEGDGRQFEINLFETESRAQITFGKSSMPVISDGKGGYENIYEQTQFYPLAKNPILYMGTEQYACTINQTISNKREFSGASGMSLGGSLRRGPGIDYDKVGSLAFGSAFNINANTGVHMNGYDWFEVSMGTKRSYQWGGIMCSNDTKLKGIFEQCAEQTGLIKTNSYMALAIAHDGTYGQGNAAIESDAISMALQNCRLSSCKIENITPAQCHSYALASDGSTWVKEANTKKEADDLAMGFCMNGGRGCKLEASFCQ